jgi:outer membrane cobalamin receptor
MSGVNLQEIALARVARVEILRGSQTARFGDNAVGGVINIVTHQAQEKPATSTEAGAGSDGWWLGRLNHSVSQHGYQFNLDSEYNHDGGWRDNSMSESSTLAVGLTKRLNDRIELNSALSWAEQNGRFPGPLTTSQYQDDPRQSNYEGPFADQYGSEQSTLRADVGARIDSGVFGELDLASSWMQRDLSWNMGPGSHADNFLETLTVSPTLRHRSAP